MNINDINVQKYPISQLFDPESKLIFEIPKYQREYTWGCQDWENLFDDLTENSNGYFLGSIICIKSSNDYIKTLKYEVVDGQQRLTTLSLLFAALYQTLNSYRDILNEDQKSDILQLKRKLVLKNTESDIRVLPQIQNNNREDFMGLLAKIGLIPRRPLPSYSGVRRIEKAYNYFKNRIDTILETASEKIAALFGILDKVNSAILVLIDVSSHADAYALFESLNNRGKPLTPVDLIKNLLLAKLEGNSSNNIDNNYSRWTEILSNLGNDTADQERFFRQNYNAFRTELNIPFTRGNDERKYPLGSIATRSTMMDIYQKIITHDPVATFNELSENAAIYGSIILNNVTDLSNEKREALLDLQRVQGAPSYLLIMYLIKYQEQLAINNNIIVRICRLLVNFFIRRNLTNTPPTQDLTHIFMSFIEDIEHNQYRDISIYTNLRQKLISKSPSDIIFEEKLNGPVYDDNYDATRFILCMIAKRGMTRENMQDLWSKSHNTFDWSIEHIFPKGEKIPICWVNMIAAGDYEKAKEYQSLYVHTFGNLTITRYNSTLSNRSFNDKKELKDKNGNYIGYRNGLNLNDDVCDKNEWTVDIIIARTRRIVRDIMVMFAL